MPHAPSSPVITDGTADSSAPVVHLTRRARIEAERAATVSAGVHQRDHVTAVPAAAEPSRASRPSFDELVADAAAPVTPPAPASPIDFAPALPAMPASTASPVTPPAPSSPVVASTPAVAPTQGPARRVLGQVPASRRTRRAATVGRPGTTAAAPHVDRATRHIPRTAPAASVEPARTAPRGVSFQRVASRVTAVGALLVVAGFVVSTSVPAQAFWTPGSDTASARTTTAAGAVQSMRVGSGAVEVGTSRDQYSVSAGTQYKNVDASSFTNDPDGTIQWPFVTGVPITSGFGGRQVEGCSFCSTNHMGVDFAPGEGTPIRVIAAGTVIKVQADDGGFGNDVWVQHDVDGKQFTSVYGHMEDNSFKVVKGQQVAVGDELGLVGSTGNSTGPHLHLEVHVDGVPVDPKAWLEANAN